MVTEILNSGQIMQSQQPNELRPLEQQKGLDKTPLQQVESGKVPASREALEKVAEEMNQAVQNRQRTLQFSVDDDSGQVVIKVLDSETDKVIRQIPSEEVLTLTQRLQEQSGGILQAEG